MRSGVTLGCFLFLSFVRTPGLTRPNRQILANVVHTTLTELSGWSKLQGAMAEALRPERGGGQHG